MTFANIHFKDHKAVDTATEVKLALAPFLTPLIHHLALNNPQWLFTCKGYKFSHQETHYAHTVHISEKREPLGKIEIGTYNGKQAFCIHNERIKESRKRGEDSKTADVKKAIKIVSKFVSRVTIGEMVEKALASAQSTAYNVDAQKYREYSMIYFKLEPVAMPFLVEHWEEFSKVAAPAGAADLPFKFNEYGIAHKVKLAHENDKTYLVLINGIDYAMKHGQGEVTLLSSEQLPDFIRRGVGMLKLVEDSQIIDGVGLRVNDHTFIVLPEA